MRERGRDRGEPILEKVVATAAIVSRFQEGQRQWVCRCCPGVGGAGTDCRIHASGGVCRTSVPTGLVLWCDYRIAPGSFFFFFPHCAGHCLLCVGLL